MFVGKSIIKLRVVLNVTCMCVCVCVVCVWCVWCVVRARQRADGRIAYGITAREEVDEEGRGLEGLQRLLVRARGHVGEAPRS